MRKFVGTEETLQTIWTPDVAYLSTKEVQASWDPFQAPCMRHPKYFPEAVDFESVGDGHVKGFGNVSTL